MTKKLSLAIAVALAVLLAAGSATAAPRAASDFQKAATHLARHQHKLVNKPRPSKLRNKRFVFPRTRFPKIRMRRPAQGR